jgi:hypothetical protein
VRAGAEVLDFLGRLPAAGYVYSHPMFGVGRLDAAACRAARRAGCLPAGAKLAKVSPSEVATVRAAVGAGFVLWDGSCRHIGASLAAGATGVVASPLSILPRPFPQARPDAVQRAVDRIQAGLDLLPSRAERHAALLRLARQG